MSDKDANFTHKSTVEFVNSKLRGVSIVNNTRVEIPYSLPGDIYHVTFFKKKRRKPFVKPDLIFQTPRTSLPPCPAFTRCGGCSAQHIPYEEQFHYKTSALLESYKKDFGTEPILYPALKNFIIEIEWTLQYFPDLL